MKPVQNQSETIYPKIDKQKCLEKFKEDKTKKEFTAGFIADEFRFIYQDKKTKTIIISFEKI